MRVDEISAPPPTFRCRARGLASTPATRHLRALRRLFAVRLSERPSHPPSASVPAVLALAHRGAFRVPSPRASRRVAAPPPTSPPSCARPLACAGPLANRELGVGFPYARASAPRARKPLLWRLPSPSLHCDALRDLDPEASYRIVAPLPTSSPSCARPLARSNPLAFSRDLRRPLPRAERARLLRAIATPVTSPRVLCDA